MMSISEADIGRTNDDGSSMLEYSNNSSAKSDEAHKTDGVTGCVDDAEYAMQLLGFTPKTFSDGLYNACVDYFGDHLESALKRLRTEVGISKISDDELHQAVTNIYTVAVPQFDSTFDKMETYLQDNVFNVSNIILEEDLLHVDYPVGDAEIKVVQQSIEEIKRKILETKYVKARLVEELEESVPAMESVSRLLEAQRLRTDLLKTSSGIVEKAQAVADILKKLEINEGVNMFSAMHDDVAIFAESHELNEEKDESVIPQKKSRTESV